MFDWLKRPGPEDTGIRIIMNHFGQMLEDGRHTFDLAANALIGGTDPEVIKADLWATDKRINKTERRIRRKIVVHGTIHGSQELPICLVMMSIVKDAERIGDYAKNLFDIARVQPGLPVGVQADLVELKDTISKMLIRARHIYEQQDEIDAKAFLAQGDDLQERCDRTVNELLKRQEGGGELAAAVLAYRFFKRVIAHMVNIITSIVVPIDRLDYYDEDRESRDPA